MPSPKTQYILGACLIMHAGMALGEPHWDVPAVLFALGVALCLRNRGQL